jgi:hypothetical protein
MDLDLVLSNLNLAISHYRNMMLLNDFLMYFVNINDELGTFDREDILQEETFEYLKSLLAEIRFLEAIVRHINIFYSSNLEYQASIEDLHVS